MSSQSKLDPNLRETAASSRQPFLLQKFVKLLPPMWYNNDLDTHHISRDRIWFLRENRFLFFTRNGPVEITLKPTTVLASAIICMVGVSVIFLSTIFASYNAIEVIRDESIQPAKASMAATDHNAQRASVLAPGGAKGDDTIMWQSDIAPRTAMPDPNGMIAGKIATVPKPLTSRLNTQPQVNAPSLRELSGKTVPNRLPIPTKTIEASENHDTQKVNMPPKNFFTTDNTREKGVDIAKADGPDSNLRSNAPISDLALAITSPKQFSRESSLPSKMPDQASDQMSGGMTTDASPLALPESNIAESVDEDSFVGTAAGFAIAMLPRLFSDPEPTSKTEEGKTQLQAESGDDLSSGPLDEEVASTAVSKQAGPLIPSISNAARARKMLLSLEGEINYIRKSISQLGIRTNYLPHYDTVKTDADDTDFKQLLITLAEHRAALRKIPFKTPMLYFYISSEYGYRKHPKTGMKTFHHGIDLAGTWQENVRSTAPGTVVFAGNEGGFGKVVRIEHDFGISTLYAHLSRITVRVGDYVSENIVIGKMGNTGRSAGAHLHYEIQVDGKSVDPSDFFTIGRQMSVSGELRQTSLTD